MGVNIAKLFFLGKTEVTQAQYQAAGRLNPSYLKGDNLPVENVSWNGAMEFCGKLTARARAAGTLPPGWKFSLPTEAQWEYACRAGTTTRFSSGNSESDLSRAGWWSGNSGSKTHPVGQKQANAWGFLTCTGTCMNGAWITITAKRPAGTILVARRPEAGNTARLASAAAGAGAATRGVAARRIAASVRRAAAAATWGSASPQFKNDLWKKSASLRFRLSVRVPAETFRPPQRKLCALASWREREENE